MAHAKHSGPGLYIVVALILAVITYIEYVIVEYPPTWMSSGWILFWLIAMSAVKFWMVIWFFMHLRDDPKLYTGFFASGMVIALGTFVALGAMFILPRAVAPVFAQDAHIEDLAEAAPELDPLDAERRALIETDGLSRPMAERAGAPRPRDGSLRVTPPAAAEPDVTVDFEPREPVAEVAPPPEPTDELEVETPPEEPVDDALVFEFDLELGATTYASCSGCHQASGQGIPGVFPPLANHAPDLHNADGGRSYYIDVMLYGLQGPITVDGTSYDGVMPAFAHLDDEAIAAVINYTFVEWGNDAHLEDFTPVRAEEVADERGKGLSPTDVHQLRQQLDLD